MVNGDGSAAAEALNDYLELLASMKNHVVGTSLQQFGALWVGASIPKGSKRGASKMCFQNSWASASRSSHLVYCEGFAVSGTLGINLPMEHAWLVDTRTGGVVERTWSIDPESPNVYFGLAIPSPTVREALKRSRNLSVSVIFGDWARQGWFLNERLPEAAELTRKLVESKY